MGVCMCLCMCIKMLKLQVTGKVILYHCFIITVIKGGGNEDLVWREGEEDVLQFEILEQW